MEPMLSRKGTVGESPTNNRQSRTERTLRHWFELASGRRLEMESQSNSSYLGVYLP